MLKTAETVEYSAMRHRDKLSLSVVATPCHSEEPPPPLPPLDRLALPVVERMVSLSQIESHYSWPPSYRYRRASNEETVVLDPAEGLQPQHADIDTLLNDKLALRATDSCSSISSAQRSLSTSSESYGSLSSSCSSALSSASTNAPLYVLDNACGESALLSQTIWERLERHGAEDNLEIVTVEEDTSMLRKAMQRLNEIESLGQHYFSIQLPMTDMRQLGEGSYSYVFSAFSLPRATDAAKALAEMHFLVKPGGTCGISVWSSLSVYSTLRDILSTIDGAPKPASTDNGVPPSSWACKDGTMMHDEITLRAGLKKAGFVDIETTTHTASIEIYKLEFIATFSHPSFLRSMWDAETIHSLQALVKPAMLAWFEKNDIKSLETTGEAVVAIARKSINAVPNIL